MRYLNSNRVFQLSLFLLLGLFIVTNCGGGGGGGDGDSSSDLMGAINVPKDYQTIQEAIDAAVDGDTILIEDGEHSGIDRQVDGTGRTSLSPLSFRGKSLTIKSINGPDNCIIYANYGIIIDTKDSEPSVVKGVTINGWYHTDSVIYCASSPLIENCIINFKSPKGIHCANYTAPIIKNCSIIIDGQYGIYCDEYSTPTITNCTISRVNGGGFGDLEAGIYCYYSTPKITDCKIDDIFGRGIELEYSSPLISNTIISNVLGNGIYCNISDPKISNCLIIKNRRMPDWILYNRYQGVGIRVNQSSPVITNCTIADNTNGVTSINMSYPIITNSILWNNEENEIYDNNSVTNITNSNIKGGFEGEGNIDIDPLFIDSKNDNYHLAWGSPCIDREETSLYPVTDIEGTIRPQGLAGDMGAYEGNSKALIFPEIDKPLMVAKDNETEQINFKGVNLTVIKNQLLILCNIDIEDVQIQTLKNKLIDLNVDVVGIISNMQMLQVQIPEYTIYEDIANDIELLEGVKLVVPNLVIDFKIEPTPAISAANGWDETSNWIDIINAPEAWNYLEILGWTYGRSTIGIVDVGYCPDCNFNIHKENLKVLNTENEEIPPDTWDGPRIIDHGTWVASFAAGDAHSSSEDDNDAIGVSWKSPLVFVDMDKNISEDNRIKSTGFHVSAGIEVAIYNSSKIINVSVGTEGGTNDEYHKFYESLDNAIERAHNAKALIVFAAGNEKNKNRNNYFSNISGLSAARWQKSTIIVGGIDKSYNIWDEPKTGSNEGGIVEIAAPAHELNQTPSLDGYITYVNSGTSFAAPMVTGTAALIKTIRSDLTPSEIKTILINSSNKEVIQDGVNMDCGLLDAEASVKNAIFYNVKPEIVDISHAEGSYRVYINWDIIAYATRHVVDPGQGKDLEYTSGKGRFLNYKDLTSCQTVKIRVAALNEELDIQSAWSDYIYVDDVCPPIEESITWYQDQDDDGFGNPEIQKIAATQPSGYVMDNTDCDDENESINPNANEICGDDIDNNCDGQTDEGCDTIGIFFEDLSVISHGIVGLDIESQILAVWSYTDGTTGNIKLIVDWGDGDSVDSGWFNVTNSNGPIKHWYASAGNYTVTVYLYSEDAGLIDSKQITLSPQ
jgi:hypothetical protein